jgi:hypothetical protein
MIAAAPVDERMGIVRTSVVQAAASPDTPRGIQLVVWSAHYRYMCMYDVCVYDVYMYVCQLVCMHLLVSAPTSAVVRC